MLRLHNHTAISSVLKTRQFRAMCNRGSGEVPGKILKCHVLMLTNPLRDDTGFGFHPALS